MTTLDNLDGLRTLRRGLHRHPEPAWCEYYTTARIVRECRRIGVDELHIGPDTIDADERMAVPDKAKLEQWAERAREAGADPDLVDRMAGGRTGAIAVLDRGPGPVVALRVDIDGLPIEESTDGDHIPAAEDFRSELDTMHACGHDAHATIGLGVLESVADSEFQGTCKVIFQPAEEVVGGGRAVAESGHLDDVDFLLAIHVGLDHPTGEIVAGIDEFLAVTHFRATFEGESAHAGAKPEEGRSAMQAMAAAVSNLYGIPRHADGATRINVGMVEGGTATNIVPESVTIEGELRGGTTDLMRYVRTHADRIVESAATMHDCSVEMETIAEAPSAASDDALRELVASVAGGVDGVHTVRDRAPLGGSEDATYLMRRVQERGGQAAYVGVGTDHPGGHHTPTFDVDERSLAIGVQLLSGAIEELAETA